MSEVVSNLTPGGSASPSICDTIEIHAHPDRDILRLCGCLVRMRAQLEALERAVDGLAAVTPEGQRFKELAI